MRPLPTLLLALPLVLLRAQGTPPPGAVPPNAPAYTLDGRLQPQPGYREWIFLSSGLDMSYTAPSASPLANKSSSSAPAHPPAAHSQFDNVFVNPEAWRVFRDTGTWPDKTMFVLEIRSALSHASINRDGRSQGPEITGLEMHVKDADHGGWSFYDFAGDAPARRLPASAACYSCHRDHAAVDTTFVQFYPTLLPIATQKATLSESYRRESEQADAPAAPQRPHALPHQPLPRG